MIYLNINNNLFGVIIKNNDKSEKRQQREQKHSAASWRAAMAVPGTTFIMLKAKPQN